MPDRQLVAEVESLLERSNHLGADPRNTNYGGGNTSAKGRATDPVTGSSIDVMWVKGSGGDLGTLTASGLAGLDLGRVRAMEAVYDGDEDEIHRRLRFCAFGTGAAPSIDTTMHALLEAPHVDHLHPDSIIALATAADGEALTQECFGGSVAWIPWIRPGFDLALQLRQAVEDDDSVIGAVLGGHGLTTWGPTSEACRDRSLSLIAIAAEFIATRGKTDPLGGTRPAFGALDRGDRVERARALAPVLRGLASTDRRTVGHWRDDDVILDFIASERAPAVVPLGTSCPDHLIRTKVRPLLLDLPSSTPVDDQIERLSELHAEYRAEYRAYYEAAAGPSTPTMRGADPAIVLVPGVGMFSYGPDSQTARIAGEFYVNAINVITGAEAVSTYAPISDAEKFRVEYWDLEEEKLRRRPAPRPLTGRVAVVTGAASGIGKAIATRLHHEGAVVALLDIDPDVERVAGQLGSVDTVLAVETDLASETSVEHAIHDVVTRFGGIDIVVNNAGLSASKPVTETTAEDWDVQYSVMARGSFLVAKHAAKAMISQGTGGDIVNIASKNAIVAGADNVAYGSAKASQAHQARLLAVELAEFGIRVNSVNPDAVVRGSGIFEGEWGDDRAVVYGVERSELGQFYAKRTLLKKEVLPEHVAGAVFVLVGDELPRTTGHFIGVDGGLPAAFPR